MPWSFPDELAQHGPESASELSLAESKRYCARLAATHYENFHVLTWFTPRHLREPFAAVYAYCRWSDDLGDEVPDRDRARALLAWWRSQLEALYRGEARHPVMKALREVVAGYQIPIQPFADLLSAFEQDQEVLDYETYPQLLDYCNRSANPVGRIVLHLYRACDEPRASLSDATCTALQLANFWQDVVPDLARGRIYLPREDRERFGVSHDDLTSRHCTPAFQRLMRFEVDRARRLFELGRPLVDALPPSVAVDVGLFTRGGLAILEAIERQRYDVLSRRPSLGKSAKAALLARAVAGRLRSAVRGGSYRGEPGVTTPP